MKVEFKVTDYGIIIDNTNYGDLVYCHLPNGTTVVMDNFYVDMLFGHQGVEVKPFSGMIYTALGLVLECDKVKLALQNNRDVNVKLISGTRDFHMWSASKATVDAVASYMSTLGERLAVVGHARNLGIYRYGVEVTPRKRLSDYYDNVDTVDIEETTW